ncbi:m7GpppN-mRNA hydrolase NUDT17 [Chanos chanos]|uniref:m7GpppN-mRNA hydrolase NUDT17 n=1 Tax=Chanos chanos TaxID=29144 RepID=A0A6J2W4F9_CHACN|nr:nucleoside diphosphate-linked moiety X motif 17 [Chanos chanos]XP_030638247.1 nucleoside diphosphate-linked moiety X motif 17 [Chanos chanos]
MEKVRKILVHLSKDNSAPRCARFVQSITGHFTENLDEVKVNCSLENNRFVLCPQDRGGGVPLKRASFCPFKYLSASDAATLPQDVLSRGVDVGVAVLLQSVNQRLLLTRRASSLRIFPNVWVPPGGHVELDERLLDAGLRELREETGLKLDPAEISSQLLGLWESVFPPMLSRGLPRRHHIVVYMLLQSQLTHMQLQACLRPEPAEVSGCVWLDAEVVKAIVRAVDGEEGTVNVPADIPQNISVSEVSPEGEISESSLPVTVFCNRAPAQGEDVERVSTGTKYALELWLKTLESRSESG